MGDHHTAKLSEIITGSNACAALVKGRYSALEIDSWAIQQTQAEAVLAGGTLAAAALPYGAAASVASFYHSRPLKTDLSDSE